MGSEHSEVLEDQRAVEVTMGWTTCLGLAVSVSAAVHKG